jgi:pimeloyl-ACP methyl ester carboxylesterase
LLGNLNSKETSATIEEGMKHISSPVLLMFGENDFIIPPKSSIEYIKENATNSALFYSTIIPGAKHSPMSENKEKTLEEILTFLEKNKKYIKK